MNRQCFDATRGTVSLDRPTFGGVIARVQALPANVWRTLIVWQDRARQRHQLASLDDHLLRDMGLDRADVERETALPFWRER
jgi:uncharacterized protein YjiS (DUF1127 family)